MGALPPPSSEQQAVVDAVLGGHNVAVLAEAGAGKTTTLLHVAQAHLAETPDAHVCLLMYNTALCGDTQNRVAALGLGDRVHCYTVHSLAAQMWQVPVPDNWSLLQVLSDEALPMAPFPFTLIAPDEAQDLTREMVHVIRILLQLCRGGQCVVVGDRRQEVYGYATGGEVRLLEDPATYLPEALAPWVTLRLQLTYRCPAAVCHVINSCWRTKACDPEIISGRCDTPGPPPLYIIYDSPETLGNFIAPYIRFYGENNTMVTCNSLRVNRPVQQLVNMLHTQHEFSIYCAHRPVLDSSGPQPQAGRILVSTHHRAKGLERDLVIVETGGFVDAAGFGPLAPEADGHYHLPSTLHVSMTRTKERLILLQQATAGPHPVLDMNGGVAALEAAGCEVHRLCGERRQRPVYVRRPEGMLSERRLVAYQSITTLRALRQVVAGAITEVTLGQPLRSRPRSVIPTGEGGGFEIVSDLYAPAIKAAAARVLLPETASALEDEAVDLYRVGPRRRPHNLPAYFKALLQRVRTGQAPLGPSQWLALAAMVAANRYPHELHRLDDMRWLKAAELEFFHACVGVICKRASQAHTVWIGPWVGQGMCVGTDPVYGRRLGATLDLDLTFGAGRALPHVLSMNDRPTEEDLLRLCLHACFDRRTVGVVLCIPAAKAFRVEFGTAARLGWVLSAMVAGADAESAVVPLPPCPFAETDYNASARAVGRTLGSTLESQRFTGAVAEEMALGIEPAGDGGAVGEEAEGPRAAEEAA